MRMPPLLAGIAVALAPMPAAAADWYRVGANEAGTTLAIVDKDSIRLDAQRQGSATIYLISGAAIEAPMPGVVAFRNDAEINCESGQMRFVHLRALDAGQAVV